MSKRHPSSNKWVGQLIVAAADALAPNIMVTQVGQLNTLRPIQNDVRHFTEDIFKRILFNESVRISIPFSLKFVLKFPIDNKSALV